jgi:SAM-dependent methyltransferase
MRLAYDYVVADAGESVRDSLDATPEEFSARMGYVAGRFQTRGELLTLNDEDWAHEVHAALRELLDPARRTLSIGSGYGEHEARLAAEGYRVVASDIVEEALTDAARLFPELETRAFNVLEPGPDAGCDDVLIASLDYAFDDEQLGRALRNVRALLPPGGRLIFVHRYQDTLGTRLIDRVLAPGLALAMRAKARMTGSGIRIVRRSHGFRRTRRELRELAARSGFRVGRVRYAGFAFELFRIDVPRRVPALYRIARRLDRRMRTLNIATVLELMPEETQRR